MAGRPTKMNDEVRKKMEEVAALDGTIEEMAYYCDVSRQTIYEWLKEDKVLSDRIERLRQRPVLLARQTINKRLTESYSNAVDYLKRKRSKEFGDKQDITSNGESIQPILVKFIGDDDRDTH